DEEDDYALAKRLGSRKKAKGKSGDNWLLTRIGLLVLFIGLGLVSFAVLFDQVGMLLKMLEEIRITNALAEQRFSFTERPDEAWKTLLKISSILFLVLVLPGYVGNLLTLFGPRSGGVVGTAVAVLVVAALGWLVYLLFHVLFVFDNPIIRYGQVTSEAQARTQVVMMAIWYDSLPRLFVALPL